MSDSPAPRRPHDLGPAVAWSCPESCPPSFPDGRMGVLLLHVGVSACLRPKVAEGRSLVTALVDSELVPFVEQIRLPGALRLIGDQQILPKSAFW